MEKLTRILVAALSAIAMSATVAHADETSDYRKFVEDTKTWVYSMDLPQFEVREIPEKYKDESAVYIAVYDNLSLSRDAGSVRMPGTLRFSDGGHVEEGDLERKLIYINDRAALDEFSEYDYRTNAKHETYKGMELHRAAIGIRVIKPDGTVVDINTDDYVEVKEGKKGKDVRNKIAVPGLEVGDILDVFYYVYRDFYNVQPDPMAFVLREDYPVMNYTIQWLIDGKLSTSYRSLNGAPDFEGSMDGAGNFHLKLEATDLPAKPRLYYDGMIQSPLVKMYVYNTSAGGYIPKSSRAIGVRPNPDVEWIKSDLLKTRMELCEPEYGTEMLKEAIKSVRKVVKNLADAYKSGQKSQIEVADCAYNLLCFAYFVTDTPVIPLLFDLQFQSLMESIAGDSLKLVVTTKRTNEPLDEVISLYGITTGLALPDGKRYYFAPLGAMAPSDLHPDYAGRRAQEYMLSDLKKNIPGVDTVYFNLPEPRALRNREYSQINVTLDGKEAVVKRTVSCSGSAKLSGEDILAEEDVVKAYLDYFKTMGLDIEMKEGGKKAADREARYATDRTSQQDDFKDEVKNFHKNIEADSVKGNVLTVGIDPKSSKLTYQVDYIVRNVVRNAGKNLLVSVGALTEDFGEVFEPDRQRDDYVVARFAREFINKLELAIPSGYTVSEKSLEALNRQVSNPAGTFGVNARVEDDKLIVELVMHFDRRFLSAEAWSQMLELLDAASEWQSATVLLEKS